ncbi:MAG: tRNA pseudouridine(55) synthase TruB [Pyrinomonadaceae bacterium]
MNGLLIIDKPAGLTSHDVVARVRRILKTKRVGHTGTLDPFATGVMVILVGQATRLAQFLDKDQKEYEALVRFGFETDTGDCTGSPKSQVPSPKSINVEDIERVLPRFRDHIEQTPPMYSAKKVEGKKLYELARKGVEIERKAVAVGIYELGIIRDDELRIPQSTIRIRVVCSAGTYIRTLAEDIGRSVGVGAHLAELRRNRAGRFNITRAVTLSDLEQMADPVSSLIPMTEAVTHLPEVILNEDRVAKTKNGLSSRFPDVEFADGDTIRMVNADADLIAIGVYNAEEKTVQPKVVLG